MSGDLTVAAIAGRLSGTVEGDGDIVIAGVSGVRDAEPGDITFVASSRYAAAAAVTRASAVFVGPDWSRPCPASLIRVARPDTAFSEVVSWFAPAPVAPKPGVHPSAIVAGDADLGSGVTLGPHCVVEAGARIGDGCVLFAGCYVGHDSRLGEGCRAYPNVSIRERTVIGARCIFHNGAVIGSDGFGFMETDMGRAKIPQTGVVVVGDDVEIGANATIDRARFGKTRIGNGVKIDNLVHVAHNVVLGDNVVVAAQVGFAGSTRVEAGAMFGGQAGITGHITIGERAIVGAQAGVTKDIPPGVFVSGYPAAPHSKARKIHAHLMRLPDLKARVAALEKRLEHIESDRRPGAPPHERP